MAGSDCLESWGAIASEKAIRNTGFVQEGQKRRKVEVQGGHDHNVVPHRTGGWVHDVMSAFHTFGRVEGEHGARRVRSSGTGCLCTLLSI
jgi:hypothetical protein